MTNPAVFGLALLTLGALVGLLQRRWSLPVLLLALAGAALAAFGFLTAPTEPEAARETVLASDAGSDAAPGGAPRTAGAGAVPEHTIPGETRPWVQELARLIEDPEAYPLFNSGVAEDGLNAGDRYYEYARLELSDRTLDVVFLTRSPDDPDVWMLHLEPGQGRPPIATSEFGRTTVLGQGEATCSLESKTAPSPATIWSGPWTGRAKAAGRCASTPPPTSTANTPARRRRISPDPPGRTSRAGPRGG